MKVIIINTVESLLSKIEIKIMQEEEKYYIIRQHIKTKVGSLPFTSKEGDL